MSLMFSTLNIRISFSVSSLCNFPWLIKNWDLHAKGSWPILHRKLRKKAQSDCIYVNKYIYIYFLLLFLLGGRNYSSVFLLEPYFHLRYIFYIYIKLWTQRDLCFSHIYSLFVALRVRVNLTFIQFSFILDILTT